MGENKHLVEISQIDYRVSVPTGWIDLSTLVFVTPTAGESPFAANISIQRWYRVPAQSPERLVDDQLQKIKESLDGFELLKDENISVANMPARLLEYRVVGEQGLVLRQMQIHIVHETCVFVLSYTNLDSIFEMYLKTFHDCINSFMLVDQHSAFSMDYI